MGSYDPVLLTKRSALEMKRMLLQFRREFRNAKRTLAIERGRQGSYQPEPKVRFKNNSSETVPAYGVMRITGGEAKKHLTIDKPDTTLRPLYLVNGPTDITAGKFGFGRFLTSQAVSFRHQYVLYDSANTPAYGEMWGPSNNSWKLKKHHYGFTIIGANDTEETLTAAIQRPVETARGKADAAIALDASGTVSLWSGTQGSETDTGLNVTGCWNDTIAIGQDDEVQVVWFHGLPYVSLLPCEV